MNRKILRETAQRIASRDDLLRLLNEIKATLTIKPIAFTMTQMMTLCRPVKNCRRYRKIIIQKKDGSPRVLLAPGGSLKWFQMCLNELFKSMYEPSDYAMGFVRGRSVVDNARVHLQQNYVFNIDLKDFFTSIDQARVWKRLQLPPFDFPENIASIIAGLCSTTDSDLFNAGTRFYLPQGAPTSPLLSNAVCTTLDRRLAGLAKRFGLHYTRYADDITFSSMHNVYQENGQFREELTRIIKSQGFEINAKKVRLTHRSRRQEVTGLTVGKKVNVPKRYIKDLRAVLHIWEKYGEDSAIASYYPRYIRKSRCYGRLNLRAVVMGKLNYLKMVKGASDAVYLRLKAQFDRITAVAPLAESSAGIKYLLTYRDLSSFETALRGELYVGFLPNKRRRAFLNVEGMSYIPVFVSKNADPDNKDNTRVSLCCQTDESGEKRWFYMIHRDYYHNLEKRSAWQTMRSKVRCLVKALPELKFIDDSGIME